LGQIQVRFSQDKRHSDANKKHSVLNNTNKPSLFNICCLNVCGLMSKLKDPDFLNIFQNYDILSFQETKTDNLDHLSLPDGFTYVAKHRKKCLNDGLLVLFSTECFLLASLCLLS
jgi:hypothetical protein